MITLRDESASADRGGDRRIPGAAETKALLKKANTPLPVLLHQYRVAEVALRIGRLYARGAAVDPELLEAAARLHDILKTQPEHADRGAVFLRENGFPEVAEIVREHTDLSPDPSAEAMILYLADKYVDGTQVASLDEREKSVRQKFAGNPQALEAAIRRINAARKIERRIEKIAGVFPLLQYLL